MQPIGTVLHYQPMPVNSLRHWRTKRGWDVFQLATRADVSDRLIRKIEAEKNYVAKADTMQKLADALELPVFAVFFPTDMRVMNGMMSELVLQNVNRMIRKSSLISCEEVFNMHLHQRRVLET